MVVSLEMNRKTGECWYVFPSLSEVAYSFLSSRCEMSFMRRNPRVEVGQRFGALQSPLASQARQL